MPLPFIYSTPNCILPGQVTQSLKKRGTYGWGHYVICWLWLAWSQPIFQCKVLEFIHNRNAYSYYYVQNVRIKLAGSLPVHTIVVFQWYLYLIRLFSLDVKHKMMCLAMEDCLMRGILLRKVTMVDNLIGFFLIERWQLLLLALYKVTNNIKLTNTEND